MEQLELHGSCTRPLVGSAPTGNDAVTLVGKSILLHRFLTDAELQMVLELVEAKNFAKARSIHGEAIAAEDILEVRISAHRTGVVIAWRRSGKTIRREYNIDNFDERMLFANWVMDMLGSRAIAANEQEAIWKSSIMPALAIVFLLALGITSFFAINDLANGNVEVTGPRAGLKTVYLQIISALGPTGIIVATLIAVVACAARIAQRYKQPRTEHVVRVP